MAKEFAALHVSIIEHFCSIRNAGAVGRWAKGPGVSLHEPEGPGGPEGTPRPLLVAQRLRGVQAQNAQRGRQARQGRRQE